ncbi:tRNA (adenosine(37)-N6)-threonylcarbamoyltransferase complex ATPase subunit type 1 TsaE [Paraflavisolibacter sp. H34]|uniref:tRNA (adenosine(37)-N6)-threonylcarbamoyltransferase complex ATPase subunit type 1 TsaE n=1 Tax=Huijunlia imazamoxiresistens TaxID=3127457 RepID=UPI003015962B
MMFEVSIEELPSFARKFWEQVQDATVFAFYGPMGAGKTTLITALCKSKGVDGNVSSPTFSIINEYMYSGDGQRGRIYHMDLYRLNSQEEAVQAGVEDCLYSGDICLVEWPEKAPDLLPPHTVRVHLEALDESCRRIKVEQSRQ